MERESISLSEQNEEKDYTQGFNHAAILAEYRPELLADIEQNNNPISSYYDGFFSGKEFFQSELSKAEQFSELQSLRNKSQERDNEREL